MNLPFLKRAIVIILSLTGLILLAGYVFPAQIVRWVAPGMFLDVPTGPPPPPPTITAPRGPLPTGVIGLKEYQQKNGADWELRGSGFILRLPNSQQVVGVTTAHSLGDLGNIFSPIAQLGLGPPDDYLPWLTSAYLYGPPGIPRTGADLRVDYVLISITTPISPLVSLDPDPRGAPQPGETVVLYGGVIELNGGDRVFTGTVLTSEASVIWVQFESNFEPGMLSGSPLISAHTGQVVGMAIAAHHGEHLILGFHPIGHIVAVAQAATVFPRVIDYRP